MAFIKVGPASALPEGETIEAIVDCRAYAVCNAGGVVRCLDGTCPCTGGPLSKGVIRQGRLVCPWHNGRFECHTGICADNASVRVPMYAVKIEDGDIYVDVKQPLESPELPRS